MSIRTYTKERIDELLASAINAAKGASAPLTHGSRHRAGGEDPIPAALLSPGREINTLSAPGTYYQNSSAGTTVANGYPFANFAGAIEVLGNGTTMQMQRATHYYPGNVTNDQSWERVRYSGAQDWANTPWGAWKRSADGLPSQVIGSSAYSQSLMTMPSRDALRADIGGSPIVISNTDMDTLRTPGLYYAFTGNTNTPPAIVSNAYVEVITYPGNYAMQRWTTFSGNRPEVWVRTLAAVWTPWVPVSAAQHRDVWGVGSPLGRFTPDGKGVRYIDREATFGARQWFASGANASTWVVSDGDTGDRNIATLLASPITVITARLSRVNSIVNLYLDFRTDLAWNSGDLLLTIPAGFRTAHQMYLPPAYGGHSSSLITYSSGITNWYWPQATSGVRFSAQWRTSDPWPTALPGSAA